MTLPVPTRSRPMRRVALLLCVLVCPLLLPGLTAHAAHTQIVSRTDDVVSAIADCTLASAGCTLRNALAVAASGDTVALAPSITTPATVTLTQGQLTIATSVTIQGAGLLTVDANHLSRVFQVNAGTVEMDGVTITHGQLNMNSIGGGIYASGGSLTLVGCTVTNNTLTGTSALFGAGIFTIVDLTLTNTTVSGNTATNTSAGGGPVNVVGGGIVVQMGATTITHSTIAGNSVQLTGTNTDTGTKIQGGGIYESNGTLTVTSSTISGNTVSGGMGLTLGGGLTIFNSATITNSTIADNTVTGGNGGGIVNGGTLTMTSSTITRNAASTGGRTSVMAGTGGGMYAGTTTLLDALIAGNSDATGQPDAFITATSGSRNNLIGNGSGLTGITNGSAGNQIGTTAHPIDPKLDPAGLAANGSTGPLTVALLSNSPAIDAGGMCPAGVTTDERGKPRVGACDIGAYEYQPVVIARLDPASGANTGGTTVTITGAGFGTNPAQVSVRFGTTTATVTQVTDTQLTVTAPPGSGTVDVSVTVNGQSATKAGAYTYGAVAPQPTPPHLSGGTGGGNPAALPATRLAAATQPGVVAPQPTRHP